MKRLVCCVIVVLVGALNQAVAAPQTLILDVEVTSVNFTLGSTLHEVHGILQVTAGEIAFDLETGAASGKVIIDARRTDTGNARRDKKMHSEVLESERYPVIEFTADSIAGSLAEHGEAKILLHGVVSIQGDQHPLSLEAELSRMGDRVRARCSFVVPFVEWGMKDPSGFLLRTDKHVDVSMDVHGALR